MTTIQVRTQFEGVHCYPGAPDEVAYLREPHRHIFGVCVEVEVFNEDRELEFIMVKHLINGWIGALAVTNNCYNCSAMSCEKMAELILNYSKQWVKNSDKRYWKVTVDEDGENGASVEYCVKQQVELHSQLVKGQQNIVPNTGAWTLDEYQKYAYQNIQPHGSHKEEVMHWAIGLGEEAGETLSVLKHRYYAGHYTNDDDMIEDLVNELGDTLWHISALCAILNISLEDVAKYNIAKLNSRYPNGFEKKRSEARHEVYRDWKSSIVHDDIMKQIKEKRGKKK